MINIPTTKEIYDGILADLEAEFTITIPLIGPSFLRALAAVLAGVIKLNYLAIASVQKNIFIDTADPESQGGTLQRFGFVKLGRYPFTATQGQYTIQLTTLAGALGTIIPANTTFKSDDDSLNPGIQFILDNVFTINGVDIITVRCLTPGLEGQLSLGDTMTLNAPIALVDDLATVLTEPVEPQAAEDIEEYRRKALDAYRLEPQGGAPSDYRLWSSDAQGVQQSYPYVAAGNSNQINLFVEATTAGSSDGKGTPTAQILTDVKEAVEDPTAARPGRKPLGVFLVNYLPIVVKEIDITVPSFVGLDATTQALILSAMETELDAIRPYIGGISPLTEKNDIFDTNRIVNVILNAKPGAVFAAPTMTVSAILLSTYTFDNGEIPYLNSITYT